MITVNRQLQADGKIDVTIKFTVNPKEAPVSSTGKSRLGLASGFQKVHMGEAVNVIYTLPLEVK